MPSWLVSEVTVKGINKREQHKETEAKQTECVAIWIWNIALTSDITTECVRDISRGVEYKVTAHYWLWMYCPRWPQINNALIEFTVISYIGDKKNALNTEKPWQQARHFSLGELRLPPSDQWSVCRQGWRWRKLPFKDLHPFVLDWGSRGC